MECKLPYYPINRVSWTIQWFNSSDYRVLMAYDCYELSIGYVIYRRVVDAAGKLIAVELTQCEANPNREDACDIVRYLLAQVMGPLEVHIERFVRYMRGSNVAVLEELREAGFNETLAENLMLIQL